MSKPGVVLRRPVGSGGPFRRSRRPVPWGHWNLLYFRPLTHRRPVLTIAMPFIRAPRAKLAPYRSKRDFANTREPSGKKAVKPAGRSYLIQKHAASRLHYDFRLE